MKLYNTLNRKVEDVVVNENGFVHMYNCGPTVYYHMHIGNIRAYVCWDILHRALLLSGYKVKRIMNITDVGHLTSDEDFGEDKLEKGAKRDGVTPFDIADFYTTSFLSDFRRLNMLSPSGDVIPEDIDVHDLKKYGWTRATEYVEEMVKYIAKLVDDGYAYETSTAVYFDVTKYDEYTKLSGQRIEDKLEGVRDEVVVDREKKSPVDFALWMKRVGEHADHYMHWTSPWGDGFPGWHIECSVMGSKELEGNISIHTGGVDHISVHHTNERAQNYGYYGKEIVSMWVHNEFLTTKKGDKLSKSAGTGMNLNEILQTGFEPNHIRYIFATVNYRIPMIFSIDALNGAKNAYISLIKRIQNVCGKRCNEEGEVIEEYMKSFISSLNEDLNVSEAMAITNKLLSSDYAPEDIIATICEFDKVWGFNLKEIINGNSVNTTGVLPERVTEILDLREKARSDKDYLLSDKLRSELLSLGYTVLDTSQGQKLVKE